MNGELAPTVDVGLMVGVLLVAVTVLAAARLLPAPLQRRAKSIGAGLLPRLCRAVRSLLGQATPEPARHWLPCVVPPASATQVTEADYVVVGAGPGGLAAAARLLDLTADDKAAPTVLLIDQGGLGPANDELAAPTLPGYALHLPSPRLGGRANAVPFEPFPGAKACGTACAAGVGLGGTSLIGRGVHYAPPPEYWASAVAGGDGTLLQREAQRVVRYPSDEDAESVVPVALEPRVAAQRLPLTWAFAQSCRRLADPEETDLGAEDLPLTFRQTYTDGLRVEGPATAATAFPLLHRVGYGVGAPRHHVVDALLSGAASTHRRRLLIVHGASVAPLSAPGGRVAEVSMQLGAARHTVAVRRGVVCAAGTFQTPALLRPLLPADGVAGATDAITVPLIFQARPGVSGDACNAHTFLAAVRQALLPSTSGGGGPLTASVTDSTVAIRCPNGVQCTVECLGAGGFSRELFAAQQWSPSLGLFREALTLRLVVFPSAAAPNSAAPQAAWAGPDPAALVEAAVFAMRWCRHVVATEPLSLLLAGREALDLELLPEAHQAPDAFRLLYGKVDAKLRGDQRVQARTEFVAKNVSEGAATPEYCEAYVRRHARAAGFACGTVADSLSGLAVPDVSNVVVGDASAIRTLCPGGGGNVLTAAVVGSAAAVVLATSD